jgi:hypothetical protein
MRTRRSERAASLHLLVCQRDSRAPSAARWLQPGDPTSPEECCLGLLSSDPDPVHSSPPCGTRFSTLRGDRSPTRPDLEREFNPAMADCGCRAPPTPHLARPRRLYPVGPEIPTSPIWFGRPSRRTMSRSGVLSAWLSGGQNGRLRIGRQGLATRPLDRAGSGVAKLGFGG